MDRRTSVLLRKLKQKEALVAQLSDAGDVSVEGQALGRLEGFRFRQGASQGAEEARAMRQAAQASLLPEFNLRADRFYNAPDTEIDYTEQGGLMWGEHAVGKLVAGDEPLRPKVQAFVDDEAGAEVRAKVERRLGHFVERRVQTLMEPLVAMQRDETLTGLARGFAFRMVEGFGVVPRAEIAQEVRDLDQEARAALRKHGIRFGQFTIFLPALLKPAPTRLRLVLWSLSKGLDAFPEAPPPGLVTIATDPQAPQGYATMSGYREAGERAIRIDMLERLADMLRAEDSRAGFEAKPGMLSITGTTLEQFARLMEGLGYRAERAERPKRPPEPKPAPEEARAQQQPPEPPNEVPEAPPETPGDLPGEVPPGPDGPDIAPDPAPEVPQPDLPQPDVEPDPIPGGDPELPDPDVPERGVPETPIEVPDAPSERPGQVPGEIPPTPTEMPEIPPGAPGPGTPAEIPPQTPGMTGAAEAHGAAVEPAAPGPDEPAVAVDGDAAAQEASGPAGAAAEDEPAGLEADPAPAARDETAGEGASPSGSEAGDGGAADSDSSAAAAGNGAPMRDAVSAPMVEPPARGDGARPGAPTGDGGAATATVDDGTDGPGGASASSSEPGAESAAAQGKAPATDALEIETYYTFIWAPRGRGRGGHRDGRREGAGAGGRRPPRGRDLGREGGEAARPATEGGARTERDGARQDGSANARGKDARGGPRGKGKRGAEPVGAEHRGGKPRDGEHRGGKPRDGEHRGGKPRGGERGGPAKQSPKRYSAGPSRDARRDRIDPDNPFAAALMGLRDKE